MLAIAGHFCNAAIWFGISCSARWSYSEAALKIGAHQTKPEPLKTS